MSKIVREKTPEAIFLKLSDKDYFYNNYYPTPDDTYWNISILIQLLIIMNALSVIKF